MRHLMPMVLAPMLWGCQTTISTPFPDGLEPLEDLAVEPPAATDSEAYPETTTSAVGEEEDYLWAHVRGYFQHDIADVWELMRTDPVAMSDRRDLTSVESTFDVEPEYALSYVNHIVVVNIVTLEWDLVFRGDQAGGDEGDPQRYAIRFQKTEGSSLIRLQEGSIVIEAVEPGITEFQFIERLDAPQTTTDDPLSYGEDLHATLAALLAGDPMPEWNR